MCQIELEELEEEDFAPPPATNSRKETLQVLGLITIFITIFILDSHTDLKKKTFKFWWYTNYYWFVLEDFLSYQIMWSECSRCDSRPLASMGLLAGCPQVAFKSELRWDQCETSSCSECRLLNKLNSKWNDIEEGWYGALGAKPVEVLGHWPIQPGAQGGVVMDGFLNCPFLRCDMFTFRWQGGRGWVTLSSGSNRGWLWGAPREGTTCRYTTMVAQILGCHKNYKINIYIKYMKLVDAVLYCVVEWFPT